MSTKNIPILLLLLLFSSKSSGQTDDSILARYQYHVTLKNSGQVQIDDNCQLDVSRSKSYFFSLGAEDNKKKLANYAGIAEKTGHSSILSAKDLKKDIVKYCIIKNYRTKEAIIVQRVQTQQLGIVKDTLSASGWTITKERKLINKLSCLKALKQERNRSVTAWFAPSIPLQEGPFYYYGLPGLIVNLSDDLGWEAQLTILETSSSPNDIIKIPQYTTVSVAQLEKAKRNERELSKQGIYTNGDKIEKTNN